MERDSIVRVEAILADEVYEDIEQGRVYLVQQNVQLLHQHILQYPCSVQKSQTRNRLQR